MYGPFNNFCNTQANTSDYLVLVVGFGTFLGAFIGSDSPCFDNWYVGSEKMNNCPHKLCVSPKSCLNRGRCIALPVKESKRPPKNALESEE